MESIEKLIICGNEEQVSNIQKRLCSPILQVVSINLIRESPIVIGSQKTEHCLFIVADEQQSQLLGDRVPNAVVLNYYIFRDTTYDYPGQQFFNENIQGIKGLVFGMSHSECGLSDNLIKEKCYLNFSLPSLDLFLQLRFFQKICSEYRQSFSQLDKVIVELPYYIFNYDLSRFGSFVLTKLNYFRSVGDYHHFAEKQDQVSIIKQLDLYMELFPNKEIIKPRRHTGLLLKIFYYIKFRIRSQYQAWNNNDSVWRKLHKETITENKSYWNQFLMLLHEQCPNASVSVLVMPFNPLFRWNHKTDIQTMKQIFYTIMEEHSNVTVVDCFDKYNNMFLFEDHCHLNKSGAEDFSKQMKNLF